jgi:hypothetical protein
MTDEGIARLMTHLRTQVAEARRLQRDGAEQTEIAERKRLILVLQQRLAYTVRDLLTVDGKARPRRPLPSSEELG